MSALFSQITLPSFVDEQESSAIPSPPRLRMLRLSVTDLCNFRCRYCMSLMGVPHLQHGDLLSLEQLADLVWWLTACVGIERVRLTGGEPLVRHGIEHLIAQISTFPGIQEVSLTTNGSLLQQKVWALKAAGLKRVNISLDSLDKERFAAITRGGSLKHTLAGIDAACSAGLTPIRINTVLQRSTWRQEVPSLLDYAAETGYEVRFIELMRMGTERKWCESELVSVDEVRRELNVEMVTIKNQSHAPAQRTLVYWHGTSVKVGWISPRSHPFCSRCERLRMDARGQLRRCLMDPAIFNLSHTLEDMSAPVAWKAFQTYVAKKVAPLTMDSQTAMNEVGG
jgi:cyclic pyranopterin phosphate synthase